MSGRAVRGKGLLIGVEIDPLYCSARDVCEEMMSRGVLSKDTHGTVARLAPPLVATKEQIDEAVAVIQRVVDSKSLR